MLKNLGNKNCELAPKHIEEIQRAYQNFKPIDRNEEDGLAAKVFDNLDFGYYKVTINRPARLKAQWTTERITELRYDKSIKEPMQWAYEKYGDAIYSDLEAVGEELLKWCEENDLELNTKKRKALLSLTTWQKHQKLLDAATQLMQAIGTDEHHDFNAFSHAVDTFLKKHKLKLSATEKNTIYKAVSWYDEIAEKVIKKKQKLSGDKLDHLLHHLGCDQDQLRD